MRWRFDLGGNYISSLFIAGNGFDIAHGIPSTYGHFRSFVTNKFPDAMDFRDEVVYLEEMENLYVDEFAAEILLHAMDRAAGNDWSDFEAALAYINFDEKLPKPNHKEDETEEEDVELMNRYIPYIDVLTSGFINCTKEWQEFFPHLSIGSRLS